MSSPRNRTRTPLTTRIGEVDPQEKARISQRMALAVQIADALSAKGMSKSQFAELMGKEPSEVTKWLSGTHNFTVNTLTDISHALGIVFFQAEEKPATQVSFVSVVIPAHPFPTTARRHHFGGFGTGYSTPVLDVTLN